VTPLGSDDYEHRFAVFVMVAGALFSTTILGAVLLTDVAPRVIPGAAVAVLGCLAGLSFARVERWKVGVRVMLGSCAVAIGPAAAMEPSGEAALSAALSWLLMGVFASLLLTRSELWAMGAACTLATAGLVGWVEYLDIAPKLQPGGLLATLGVATGYATLAQIAAYFRGSVARLQEAEHTAQEALQARGRFLANMSHELRTPLNAIIGYSELLIDDAADASAKEDLERIHWSGTALLGHINAMLDLSKLEAGQMMIHIESIDLVQLAHDLVAQHRPLLEDRSNDASVEVEAGLVVQSDPQKLQQVLSNLLTNANKFTQGGHITFHGRLDGDHVVLEVEDTGIGMKPEALDRIFLPFMQANRATPRTYGGTGLGLTLVQRFVDLLGGEITVKSVAGVGSTFQVRLPVDPPAATATPAPVPATS